MGRRLLLILVLFPACGTARAQDAADAAEAVPESEEDRATAASLADEEARANFEAGRVAFAAARYEDALAYFERAHVLSGRHQLLYNIGLCHDRLGRDAEALRSFEGFLEAAPDTHNRAEVEQRIETARVRLARAAASTPSPAPVPAPPVRGADPAGWILAGTGAAVLVAGAVLLGVGRADAAAIEAIPDGTRAWSAVRGDVERADLLTGIGAACLGLGAALAVTGVAWGVAGGGGGEAVAVRAVPGGILVGGTF